MPIYEYHCSACGTRQDVLQKVSDAPLTTCPSCGAEAFAKALTAAGFQLKGSGWYATDFKGGAKPAAANDAPAQCATQACGDACTSDAAKPAAATAASASAT